MDTVPVTLAIDTSTTRGRIAVAAGNSVVFAAEFGSERSHNSEIFAPLGEALSACGGAPERIAVGTGPGSYTGVRIGIAAGLGIALAKAAPIAGFPSVCTPAAARSGEPFTAVGDARRGALYLAEVDNGLLEEGPQLIPADAFTDPGGLLVTFDPEPPVPGAIPTHPSAAKLAVLAASLTDARFAKLAQAPPEPIYLRAPFVTQPKKPGKAVPRTRP